jgi:hypothetical protein
MGCDELRVEWVGYLYLMWLVNFLPSQATNNGKARNLLTFFFIKERMHGASK